MNYDELVKISNNIGSVQLNESADATVKTKVKAGDGLEGAKENGKPIKVNNPKVDKPVEGKDNPGVEEGKGKPLAVKKEAKMFSSFEDLYSKTINEDFGLEDKDKEIVPAASVEDENFSDETGDFEGEIGDESEEEVDVATELQLIAARLSDVAERLSGGSSATDELDATDDESLEEPVVDEDSPIKTESCEAKLKPAKKTTLGPKSAQKVSKIKTKTGKAPLPANGKDYSGKLSNAKASTLGPKMDMKVSGNGPTVKGGNEKLMG